jgi:hypothetical protein
VVAVTAVGASVESAGPAWHARDVPALRLRLVARRHVDLGRLASALCRASR